MMDNKRAQDFSGLPEPYHILAMSQHAKYGAVEYFHSGLFDDGDSLAKLPEARQRMFAHIISSLPAAGRILVAGKITNQMADALQKRGLNVTAASHSEKWFTILDDAYSGFEKLQFYEYSDIKGEYDIILVMEHACSFHYITFFNTCHDLLTDKGMLLVLDSFALCRTLLDKKDTLPLWEIVLSQAERCGFKLIGMEDLTENVKQTPLSYMDTLKEYYNTSGSVETDVAETTINALAEMAEKYADRSYGYLFAKFQKDESPRWKPVLTGRQDSDRIRRLFEEVFAPNKMSDSLWEWKYGAGRGTGVAAWTEGEMVAHYGGMERRISYFGRTESAVQIADVMVSDKERGVLTRKGAFFVAASTFPECFVGYGARFLIGFGFPNRRAMLVAERMKLYGEVDRMKGVRWQAGGQRPRLTTGIKEIEDAPLKWESVINSLWSKMSEELTDAIVGIRDWEYIRHRYLIHPEHDYHVLLVHSRMTGAGRGLFVLRHHEHESNLLDIVAPMSEIPFIIGEAKRVCALRGTPSLFTWITETFAEKFLCHDSEITDIDVRIPTSIWTPGPDKKELKDKWWLMSGDTDFL